MIFINNEILNAPKSLPYKYCVDLMTTVWAGKLIPCARVFVVHNI